MSHIAVWPQIRKEAKVQRRFGVAPLLATAVLLTACQTPGKACFELSADRNANLYDGQAHSTVVYLYPLSSTLEFEQVPAQQMLNGRPPTGMLASAPVTQQILPGEKKSIEYQFPEMTKHVGIVADLYREQGDAEGLRKVAIPAACGMFSSPARVAVGPRDVVRQ
jgi:type VI secretion system VasD/TssJ family lipoprotein